MIATGQRRTVLTTIGDISSQASLAYSADGGWLLAHSLAYRVPVLVDLVNGGAFVASTQFTEDEVLHQSAAWDPTAAGQLLVFTTTAKEALVHQLNLADYWAQQVGSIAPITDRPLYLSEPDLSSDGRSLLATTNSVWAQERMDTLGGASHVVVVDLEAMRVEVPSPLMFATHGAERQHKYPRWTQRPAPGHQTFELDHALKTKPMPDNSRDVPMGEEFLNRAVFYLRSVGSSVAPPWLLPEAYQFAAAAAQPGYERAGFAAWIAAAASGRLGDIAAEEGDLQAARELYQYASALYERALGNGSQEAQRRKARKLADQWQRYR